MSRHAPALRELGYWLHRYRRTWRGTVVISVANPLLFLTAVGFGLGQLVDRHQSAYLHGTPYLKFLLPGVLAAAMMQTATVETTGPVLESASPNGNYRAAAATPLRPVDILSGHLMFVMLRLGLSAVMFAAVGALLGAVSPARAPLLVAVAVLVGCAFATPLMAWSVTVRRRSDLNAVFRFVIMPLYMFSGTFFSVRQLPAWLRTAIEVTPLWHGVELCRTCALSGAAWPGSLIHVGYLCAMAAGGLLLARRTYQRRLHT